MADPSSTSPTQQRVRTRRELEQFLRRLGLLLAALLAVIVVGTGAYALLESTSVAFGLHWTLDTITTLGVVADPRDTGGRILQGAVELLGIGTLFYGLATVAEFFVSGQLSGIMANRRMQRMIDSFHDHFIVCGYGRVGRQVVRDLTAAGASFVVIDPSPENREAATAADVPFIESEAADDEVLEQAGIERARAVVACVDSDAENIFIALTARELRDDLLIVARASAEDSEKKLLRAGANRVISPYKTSGSAMARLALHPQVEGSLDLADSRMEEILVTPDCEGVGRTVADVRGDSVIVALRRSDGELETQPSPESEFRSGDMVVAIGSPSALERLEAVFQPNGSGSS